MRGEEFDVVEPEVLPLFVPVEDRDRDVAESEAVSEEEDGVGGVGRGCIC